MVLKECHVHIHLQDNKCLVGSLGTRLAEEAGVCPAGLPDHVPRPTVAVPPLPG